MKNITENDLKELYDDMLDECYPEVKICDMTYEVSRALKELDPTAYRCGMIDFADSENLEVE